MADEKAISLGNLTVFKEKIDNEIAEVEGKIPVIPESLPANGGNADTAKYIKPCAVIQNKTTIDKWFKIAETVLNKHSWNQNFEIALLQNFVAINTIISTHNNTVFKISGLWYTNDILDCVFSCLDLPSGLSLDNYKVVVTKTENDATIALFFCPFWAWMNINFYISSMSDYAQWQFYNPTPETDVLDELPEGTVINCQHANTYLSSELADLKAYIGYTDSDIYGLEADFENNRFTRLAGAVGKNPGADFNSVNAFGGRRRCAVANNGQVKAYYGDANFSIAEDGYYDTDGVQTQIMVEQPKFYYKVVPLKTEKIDSTNGYHLRKARYYISDNPKPGFKIHPAFIQNGIEVDKIYLSAYEGGIYDFSEGGNGRLLNDEQIADFDTDLLCSTINVKPASGTTQALTRDNARKLAQNRGAGWGITTIQTLSATQLLFAIEYAAFNSQAAIGNGVVNAAETIRTGSTSSLGNASGSVESGGVSYRGEENLWGNINTFIDGYDPIGDSTHIISTISSNDKIKMYSLKKNGYISSFNYNPDLDWCFIPCDKNGNSSLPVGDTAYGQTTTIGKIVPVFGGDWSRDSSNGLFSLYTVWEYANYKNTNGARLIYIPTEVTAND